MDLINQLLQNNLITEQTAELLRRQVDPDAFQTAIENQVFQIFVSRLNRQLELFLDVADELSLSTVLSTLDDIWNVASLDVSAQLAQVSTESVLPVKIGNLLDDDDILDAFNQINEGVLRFVTDYYLNADNVGSLPQLDRVSKDQLQPIFRLWLNGDLEGSGLPALRRALEPTFGTQRANRIAVTETSRIFGHVSKQISENSRLKTGLRWDTAVDELVCPICEPLDGAISEDNETFIHPELGEIKHPAHVNCRCDLTVVVI